MAAASHVEVFNCTVPEFYKIVSDYEKYPQFLAEVKDCKVLGAKNGGKTVEFKVSVIKTFSYRLEMTENEPNSISWTFVGGEIFKTSTGSWKLEDQGGKTKATYNVEATFSLFVPGPVTKTLLNANLPGMIAAYHRRVKELYGK